MTIIVTQQDIDRAREDPSHLPVCETCPIARAILRKVPAGTRVEVKHKCIMVGDEAYYTPVSAQDFMDAFDNGGTVTPFMFYLVNPILVM